MNPSPTKLDNSNIKSIKEQFPVPVSHKVLWADVKFGRRISGLVLTDIGIFIKGSKEIINEENLKISNKKDKINSIYHYIKWEYFDVDDFKIDLYRNNFV